MDVNEVKKRQLEELEKECQKRKVNYSVLLSLLKAEKIKKTKKRDNYLVNKIESELEKEVENEN